MASALAAIKKEATCPVCLSVLMKPKFLACSHRLCQQCLHNLIMSKDSQSAHIVQCPYCKKEENIMEKVGERHREEWVNVFKDDLLLAAITDRLQTFDTCEKHRNEPFWFYCFRCKIPLCHECLRLEHKCHKTRALEAEAEERKTQYRNLCDEYKQQLEGLKHQKWTPRLTECSHYFNNAVEQVRFEYGKVQKLVKEMGKKAVDEIVVDFERLLLSEEEDLKNLITELEKQCGETSSAAVVSKDVEDRVENLKTKTQEAFTPPFMKIKSAPLKIIRKYLAKISSINLEQEDSAHNPESSFQNDIETTQSRKRKKKDKFDYLLPCCSTSSSSPSDRSISPAQSTSDTD